MMTIRWVAVVAALVSGAASASAEVAAWTKSFEVNALRSHLDALTSDRFIVVPGEGSDSAAKAFENALRATGRASLVMDASAVGGLAARTDAEIVNEVRHLPIQIVMVVRVFTEDAVITGYDRFGATLLGITATRGKPMKGTSGAVAEAPAKSLPTVARNDTPGMKAVATAPADSATTAAAPGVDVGEGASGGAIASIGRIRQAMELRYNTNFLRFKEYKDSSGWPLYTEPVQGSIEKSLTWPEFYRVVGREDLARAFDANVATSNLLRWVVGPGFLIGGLGAGYFLNNGLYPLIGVAGALVAGGMGTYMSVQPVSAKKQQELLDAYNSSLRTQAGRRPDGDRDEEQLALLPRLSFSFRF